MNEQNDQAPLDGDDDAVETVETRAAAPDEQTMKQIIEAALMAAGQPLTVAQLGDLFDDDEKPGRDAIARALHALGEDCATRGIELVEVASGFRFQVRTDFKRWVSRLWAERQTRYSRALLETLALIAYRQPITRGEIEQIRGVAVSSNIIRTLEEREWVRVIGHRDVPGKPALFGTTKAFLDYFNLKSLDQLPPLSELREIPELEPQLALEGDHDPAADDASDEAMVDDAIVADADTSSIEGDGEAETVSGDQSTADDSTTVALDEPHESAMDSEDEIEQQDPADHADPEQGND
ncbi:MAG: SMC-Scp complex subunit ScpB [Xanthomonadales bacterium]|nr:SMC-Scp complex subunit ScpB [Xanthomonadales bacterium]